MTVCVCVYVCHCERVCARASCCSWCIRSCKSWSCKATLSSPQERACGAIFVHVCVCVCVCVLCLCVRSSDVPGQGGSQLVLSRRALHQTGHEQERETHNTLVNTHIVSHLSYDPADRSPRTQEWQRPQIVMLATLCERYQCNSGLRHLVSTVVIQRHVKCTLFANHCSLQASGT